MTKIPSVEERVEEFYFRYVIQPLVGSERLDGVAKEAVSFFREALIADRTALLTELRNSELLEEVENKKLPQDFEEFSDWAFYEGKYVGHNTLARAIREYITKMKQ